VSGFLSQCVLNKVDVLPTTVNGNKVLTSIDLGNQPEPWTEDNLIWPLPDAVGLTKDPQPYGGGDRPLAEPHAPNPDS